MQERTDRKEIQMTNTADFEIYWILSDEYTWHTAKEGNAIIETLKKQDRDCEYVDEDAYEVLGYKPETEEEWNKLKLQQ